MFLKKISGRDQRALILKARYMKIFQKAIFFVLPALAKHRFTGFFDNYEKS